MATHSLGLCLSENGFISISFLKDGLAEYNKMLVNSLYFRCFAAVALLSSTLSVVKSAINLMEVHLCILNKFLLLL